MKRDPVADALQALSEAAGRPHDAATLARVRGSLAHRSNHKSARLPINSSVSPPSTIFILVARLETVTTAGAKLGQLHSIVAMQPFSRASKLAMATGIPIRA